MAAVFCASLSRRAMVWRSLVIRTRSSRCESSGAAGARKAAAGTGVGATGAGATRRRRDGGRRRRGGGTGERLDHVALQHLAALAAAGDRRQVDRLLRGELGGRGGRRHRGRRGGLRRSGGRRLGGGLRRAGAVGGQAAEQRADRHRLTGLDGDLGQHAGGRRVDFERHLVGFELDQRLVGFDRVAALLEPFADGRFGDRTRRASEPEFLSTWEHLRRGRRPSRQGETVETAARGSTGRSATVGMKKFW